MDASGRRFVAVALAFALLIAVAANLVAVGPLGLDHGPEEWAVSIGTSLMIGFFLALLLLPRRPGGFEVHGRIEERP